MKLTDTQHETLEWLQRNGGSCYLEKHCVIAQGERSKFGSAITFLNLVVKGMIEPKNGRLVVSEQGRRQLQP